MKKVIFGIFAHPDDEAFGPSGTLYKNVRDGADVHLLLLTAGDAGKNDFGYEDLREVRLQEWQNSGQLIGASSMYHLGYNDGELRNKLYLEIAEKLLDSIHTTLQQYGDPVEVEFITFEPHGISGHLDHIAASHIATYTYLTLRQNAQPDFFMGTLKYFCISKRQMPNSNTNWLYMPAGYSESTVDEIVDISDVLDQKLKIMEAHQSQKVDMQSIVARQKATNSQSTELFIYYRD